jgi:hypothetical protein
MSRTLTRILLITLGLALLPLAASAQEARVRLDVRGFSADQKQMLVRIDDINNGLSFRMYDVETGVPAKKSELVPFQKVEEIKKLKELRKKYKIKDDGVKSTHFQMDPNDPEAQLSFFGVLRGKDGERLVVACTDGARMGKVSEVKVKQDEESKARAEASLKTIYWTTDHKLMVAVVIQNIDTPGFTSDMDELHAQKFKPDDVQWVEQEQKKEEAGEKKDEKKEEKKKNWWWPFG